MFRDFTILRHAPHERRESQTDTGDHDEQSLLFLFHMMGTRLELDT